jgi:hypothetical protein
VPAPVHKRCFLQVNPSMLNSRENSAIPRQLPRCLCSSRLQQAPCTQHRGHSCSAFRCMVCTRGVTSTHICNEQRNHLNYQSFTPLHSSSASRLCAALNPTPARTTDLRPHANNIKKYRHMSCHASHRHTCALTHSHTKPSFPCILQDSGERACTHPLPPLGACVLA